MLTYLSYFLPDTAHRTTHSRPRTHMKAALCGLCVAVAGLPHAHTFSAPPSLSKTATSTPTSSSSNSRWAVRPCDTVPRRRALWRSPQRQTTTVLAAEKIAVSVGDVKRALSAAQDRLEKNRQLFDEAKLQGELGYLEGVSSEPGFWDDGASARKTLGELNR